MEGLLAFAMKLAARLSSGSAKGEEVWPHLKLIGTECEHILTVLNGGKPVVHAGPLSADGNDVVKKLVAAGVDSSEATKTMQSFEGLQGRL